MVITLYPFDKDAFKMEDIKKELAAEGAKLLVQSEEKEIVINDYLNNSSLAGYYYMLTDKNPKEGEFKYLVQGVIKYNNTAGFYTFLHNSKELHHELENQFQENYQILSK